MSRLIRYAARVSKSLAVPAIVIVVLAVASPRANAQTTTIDSSNHIHYGTGPAVFPLAVYDFNANLCSNPTNELSLISQLGVDTVIDVVCGEPASIVSALSSNQHLWSVVSGGIDYTGADPGWANELSSNANVTGYYVGDEPQSQADLDAVNLMSAEDAAIDPTAIQASVFNDSLFGGTYPNYGGGIFSQYTGSVVGTDPYGNNSWNEEAPRSTNGLYDVTAEVATWGGYVKETFPNKPLWIVLDWYGTAAGGNCYPTLRQMYDGAWAAVDTGADAMGWWAMGQGETAGGTMCDGTSASYSTLWANLVAVTQAMKSLSSTIVGAPVVVSHVEPETTIQTAGRSGYIFASNLTQNAVSDTFSGLPSGSSVTAEWDGTSGVNRAVCSGCTSFTDSFPGFGSHVYAIAGGSATPTPTAPGVTPTPAATPSAAPTASVDPTASIAPTSAPTSAPTVVPTSVSTSAPTSTPIPVTPSPASTSSVAPTAAPISATPSPASAPTAVPTASSAPTASPVPTATAKSRGRQSPTPAPTVASTPTSAAPTATASGDPTATPAPGNPSATATPPPPAVTPTPSPAATAAPQSKKAKLKAVPGRVAFGPVMLQSSSLSGVISAFGTDAQNVTIVNPSGQTIQIESIQSSDNDFSVAPGCIGSVASNTSCTVSVTFAPTATGRRTGNLEVTTNAGVFQVAHLAGKGVPLQISATPQRLHLGNADIGGPGVTKTIVITNVSPGTVTMQGLAASDPVQFAISGSSCVGDLAPRAKCAVSVTFAPSISGLQTATLAISSNAVAGPQSLELLGMGRTPR